MADVITRLKVESNEYDSKIKRAAQGLLAMEEACRKVGGTLAVLEKDEKDFVAGLGRMETVSKSARGRLNELTQAYTELSMQYKRLTDEEKKGDFGKALSSSLEQLKGRINDVKNELADVEKELKDVDDSAGGMGEGMKTALAVMGGNLMTKAVSLAADLGAEVVSLMNQSAELAKSAEGVQMAFERLDRADILDNLRQATHNTVSDLELMKAAVKFNDFGLSLDELGTMLAFAQQKAKDTGQSVDYMVDSIVTGLGRKSVMILDNLGLSAAEISEKMKESGDMTKAVGEIIRERMARAGDYVETASDRAAQANVRLENAMLELGNSMQEVFGYSGWDDMAADIKAGLMEVLNDLVTDIGEVKSAFEGLDGSGAAFTDLAATIVDNVNPALGILLRNLGLTKQAINDILGLTGKIPSEGGGKGTGTTSTQTTNKPVYTAPGGYVEVTDKNGKVIGGKHFDSFDNNAVDNWKKTLNTTIKPKGGGKTSAAGAVWAPIEMQAFDFSVFGAGRSISNVQKNLASAQKQYNEAGDAIGRAAAQALIDKYTNELQMMKSEGNPFADAYSHDFQKDIERLSKELPVTRGRVSSTEGLEDFNKNLSQMTGGISSIASGIEQLGVELPQGFKETISTMQGISTILTGIAAVVSVIQTMQGVQTATSLIPGLQNGGIVRAAEGWSGVVPGTRFSGDNIPILANAGEIVLNTAQTGRLASALQSGGATGTSGTPYVDGEKIFLGINNYLRRTGRGEIVTAR